MNRQDILKKLSDKFGEAGFKIDKDNPEGIYLPVDLVPPAAEFLKTDPELDFDLLNFLTAVDYAKEMELVYQFSSCKMKHKLVLKAKVSREEPEAPTVSLVYPTANWHERETYDLFGVVFSGHPDLTRLMMPAEWVGHPLRKDFVHENLVPLPTTSAPVLLEAE